MNAEIKFNPSLSAAVAAQGTAANEQPNVSQEKQVTPLLGGENVKISSGAMSDLEKLVAQLKTKSEDARNSVTQLRFSAVMSALDAANVRLTDGQAEAFAAIAEQERIKASLETELSTICSNYGISSKDSASVVMDMVISSLEQAVERAVQEGKDHNETVAKTKEKLEIEQAKLDRLENAEKKDEAAIAAAKEAVSEAQGAYDEATAVAAGDAKAIADAQSALKQAKDNAGKVAELQAGIAAASEAISKAAEVIGSEKLNEIAVALSKTAEGADISDARVSNAEREKEAAKEIAFDPLNVIRESLDKIDEAILRTIDENQQLKA